jgi:hypothetical protein
MHACILLYVCMLGSKHVVCTAIPIIIEGRFQVFQRFSSSKLVLKTVESCFVALNYYGNGSMWRHVCVCLCVCFACKSIYACILICIHTHTHACIHTYKQTTASIPLPQGKFTPIHTHTYIHTYIHTTASILRHTARQSKFSC